MNNVEYMSVHAIEHIVTDLFRFHAMLFIVSAKLVGIKNIVRSHTYLYLKCFIIKLLYCL